MTETDLRRLANFFFLTLLDEGLAKQASLRAAVLLHRSLPQDEESPQVSRYMVSVGNQILKKFERLQRKAVVFANETLHAWALPRGLELGAWQEFRKIADPEEVHSLVWSQVLGVSESEIALGLGVSLGTVQHRVARGLKKLSQVGVHR